MGRFIIIVIVLVALALLINSLMQEQAEAPTNKKPITETPAKTEEPTQATAKEESPPAEANSEETAVPPLKPVSTDAVKNSTSQIKIIRTSSLS